MMTIDQLKKQLDTEKTRADIKAEPWIKLFGDRKLFNDSIMASKPKIPNSWNAFQYQEYLKSYAIPGLKSLDDWANPDAMYEYYKKKLPSTHGSAHPDSPSEDQMGMINYQEFCTDIGDVTLEMKNDLNDFGIPELQSYIGAFTSTLFVLKRFRREFYSSLYTMENEDSKGVYTQSPLRHMLLFLIEKRLNRIIPDSDTFKFCPAYFSTFEYRKESGDAIFDHLMEKHQSDMIACKFLI